LIYCDRWRQITAIKSISYFGFSAAAIRYESPRFVAKCAMSVPWDIRKIPYCQKLEDYEKLLPWNI